MEIHDLFDSIPVDKNPGWKVKIDGHEQRVGQIEISSKFGILVYGQLKAGYDSWSFYETGGGGVVTIPYVRTALGELFIGLLPENRANMGGKFFCAIGGFIEVGESRGNAQGRETEEETGLEFSVTELSGFSTNSNRAFFVTDVAGGEGVKAYGMSVPFELLMPVEGRVYKFRPDAGLPNYPKSSVVVFLPWREAIRQTPDALARAAISQLLVEVM